VIHGVISWTEPIWARIYASPASVIRPACQS
jgi:hypothetical protein